MECPTKDTRLNERLTFRLTPQEKEQITQLAEAAGVKPSDIVRRSIQSQLQLVAMLNKSGAE